MLAKKDKIWMWIFIAVFAIPEIFFSTLLSSIINYSGKKFLTLSSLFVDNKFFINNPSVLFLVLIIETISLLYLLFLSFKLKKTILIIFLILLLAWLSYILFLGYISNSISLVM